MSLKLPQRMLQSIAEANCSPKSCYATQINPSVVGWKSGRGFAQFSYVNRGEGFLNKQLEQTLKRTKQQSMPQRLTGNTEHPLFFKTTQYTSTLQCPAYRSTWTRLIVLKYVIACVLNVRPRGCLTDRQSLYMGHCRSLAIISVCLSTLYARRFSSLSLFYKERRA
jgi:hypothetical protein